jgi:hypothetical protein
MTKRLLLFITMLLGSSAAFAQFYAPDFPLNIGIYGGIAPTTRIYGPADFTKDEKSLPSIFGIMGHYSITDHLQVGLDFNTQSEWSAKGTTTLQGLNGQMIGQPGIRYVYADRVYTAQVRVNALIPVYDRLRTVRSNFYYGIGGGAIFTNNDGGRDYRQFNEQVGEEYRFVSEYRYEPAAGYTIGFQVGMEWWTNGRLGVNAEFAPRFNHLNLVDNRYAGRNGPFDVFTFPVTAGIRFRFGSYARY